MTAPQVLTLGSVEDLCSSLEALTARLERYEDAYGQLWARYQHLLHHLDGIEAERRTYQRLVSPHELGCG